MPSCRCRACGALFHLRADGDLEAWYREHAPLQKVGDVVDTLLCLECWKKAEGDRPLPGSST